MPAIRALPGGAFYRAQSAPARDLGVLAAALYRGRNGRLRVLDVMAGSGVRGMRYLAQVCDRSRWRLRAARGLGAEPAAITRL